MVMVVDRTRLGKPFTSHGQREAALSDLPLRVYLTRHFWQKKGRLSDDYLCAREVKQVS